LNLVVKSIIQQFDIPKVGWHDVVDEMNEKLLKLAGDIEDEEWSTLCDAARAENDGDGEIDNVEGWVDEQRQMNADELEELDEVLLLNM
jgi:hypothetical protein